MAKKGRPKYEPDYGESEPVRETNPLHIPEILIRVLEFASPAAKANIARACRRLSEPALKMLWQDLPDLDPVLKIFALLKNIRNSRMSSAEKLERIKSYGAWVRSLRFDAFNSSIWKGNTADVYRALSNGKLHQYIPMVSLPASGLCPNLHTLEWRADECRMVAEATIKAVSYFLHPSLKHLSVSGVFGRVIELAYDPRYGKVEYGPFFHTLTTLDGLKLESLNLKMGESTGTLVDEAIPCLRRHQDTLVHFSAWTPEFVKHFRMELFGLTNLRSLDAVVDTLPKAIGFIEELANARPEMEFLTLSVFPSWGQNEPQELWNALKRLRKLAKLHLEVPGIRALQEEDARSMREAWPSLSSLYILSNRKWRHMGPGLSRDSLSAISRHFSRTLTTLGLHFEPNMRSSLPISPVRFEKLETLFIQMWSKPNDPVDLVGYFAHILPHEAILDGNWPSEWRYIAHMLEQEQARARITLSTEAYFKAAMAKKNRPKYEPDYVYGEPDPARETNPLLIPEIWIQVLEFTSADGKARAARVCRRWSKPALEILWSDLTDLTPILNLFFRMKSVKNSLSPTEKLERTKSYCALVRTLRFDASNSSITKSGTAGVYRALCAGKLDQYFPTGFVPSSELFPNIHTLEWRADESDDLPESTLRAVSYFLQPSLKHIYVSGIFGRTIFMDDGSPWFVPVGYVPFFQTLNAIEGLRLESLELRMGEHTEVEPQADELTIFLRQHQETLVHFSAWTPGFARHFQKELWELSQLRSLEVVVDHEPQASGFVEGLANELPEIEALTLGVDPSTREPYRWERFWSTLKRLRKLTKLHLELSKIEELGEGDARSMREAWPDLSCLYILQKSGWWGHPCPGFSRDFLSAISLHFSRSLTALGLHLEPNIRSALQVTPVRFEKLQLLHIQSSIVPDDPEDVARYFAQILPHSATLEGGWHYQWKLVIHLLERERAKANDL
ncbi:hypothetical protein FS837_009411 [Tulasnella sp. UAMH 9824]|nr:hypothetical protein FS837_009411 [Tulasnella sp. UAMH 9824]